MNATRNTMKRYLGVQPAPGRPTLDEELIEDYI